MILPTPALRRLARLKLRGRFRRQWRRAKTPSGAAFTILGLIAFGLWVTSVAVGSCVRGKFQYSPNDLSAMARIGGLALTVLSVIGATGFRGLYLPKEEIEVLFAAPVDRSDIVRYRLMAAFGRGIVGGLIFGMMAAQRAPVVAFGFLGAFAAMQTLGIFGQTLAIVLGSLEKKRFEGWTKRVLQIVSLLAILALLRLAFQSFTGRPIAPVADPGAAPAPDVFQYADHPVIRALTLPFEPWIRAMTATTLAEFGVWFAIAIAIGVALAELTARLPIDYRELSLETAANIAERIRRAQKSGGGAAGAQASAGSARWRVPWLAGRGPFGAIAWTKIASLVRKSRRTLVFTCMIMVVITLITNGLDSHKEQSSLARALIFVLLGTLYLSFGMRFDFREELDRMERIKTWPVTARTVFAAILAPEWIVISGILLVGLVGLLLLGNLPLDQGIPIALAVPAFTFCVMAVDNIVFLFMPIRITPGSEAGLNVAGRSLLLLFLRVIAIGIAAGVVASTYYLTFHLAKPSNPDASVSFARAVATAASLAAFAALDLGLLFAGGVAVARFDVSRKV